MSSFSLMREDRMRENIDRTMGESGISVYDLAEEFVENTDCSVFLTGKAGTGKTTFLRRIKESTRKQAVVVAPTGVAAINAGGTTIHSFFQIPPAPYVPSMSENANFFAKQKVSAVRRKLFRQLELLIIDEISMVRADLLDLIDLILRHYRYRPKEPFGGVQVIFIGDMYQLAPVCTAEDWEMLRHFYRSPYFFHSRVLEARQPVYIELDHIFRQTNRLFIDLLNEVRNGHLSPMSVSLLEKRYNPNFSREEAEGYITLTTHNANADRINHEALDRLGGKASEYEAEVKGDFPEKSYPADNLLQLKRGAKVMFIANDKENPHRYFNGKIGTVTDMDEESVTVECDEGGEPIIVGRETWNNVQYRLDRETNAIEETVLGTYSQIPLRLAWAITIHKSQGLTFDRVIIDAGAAFASGQVYVALSRCRSLEGLVLSAPLSAEAVISDPVVDSFIGHTRQSSPDASRLSALERAYFGEQLSDLFNFRPLQQALGQYVRLLDEFLYELYPGLLADCKAFAERLEENVLKVARKFEQQYMRLIAASDDYARDAVLQERVCRGAEYFGQQLAPAETLLDVLVTEADNKEVKRKLKEAAGDLETLWRRKAKLLLFVASGGFAVESYLKKKAVLAIQETSEGKQSVRQSGERKQKGGKVAVPPDVQNRALYAALVAWRNGKASELKLPAYTVLQQKAILGISNLLPKTKAELLCIPYLGKKTVNRHRGQEEHIGQS